MQRKWVRLGAILVIAVLFMSIFLIRHAEAITFINDEPAATQPDVATRPATTRPTYEELAAQLAVAKQQLAQTSKDLVECQNMLVQKGKDIAFLDAKCKNDEAILGPGGQLEATQKEVQRLQAIVASLQAAPPLPVPPPPVPPPVPVPTNYPAIHYVSIAKISITTGNRWDLTSVEHARTIHCVLKIHNELPVANDQTTNVDVGPNATVTVLSENGTAQYSVMIQSAVFK